MNYTSVQAGSASGLIIVLHVNQNDYLYARSSSAGFRVNSINLIHKVPFFSTVA